METPRTGPAGETIDTTRFRALGSDRRAAIMRLVRASDGTMTAGDVAEQTGLHLSTARTHLDRLTDAGLLVKARASGGQAGRPAWRYRVATSDAAPAPAPYRTLAAALLDHLGGGHGDIRAVAARVGEGWGRQLAVASARAAGPADPVDTVLAILTDLGFNPRPRLSVPPDPPAEVHLHTCPFLELVAQNPDAMCGLHLGVIRGALTQAGTPGDAAVLEPFGAPAACVVRLPAPPRS